jgi:hypothetical protein
MPVIHPIPAKENPRSVLRGFDRVAAPDAAQRAALRLGALLIRGR